MYERARRQALSVSRVWSDYETVTPLPRATTLPLVTFGAIGITVLKCSSLIHLDTSFPLFAIDERTRLIGLRVERRTIRGGRRGHRRGRSGRPRAYSL